MNINMKSSLSELALFGGPQAFDEPLHVGRPNIGDPQRMLERVQTILQNRWLSNDGPMGREFERRIAELCQVKHCVAMCNGTVALEIAIRALGLSGEVILPSYTFIATAHALQWQEITPVFCDIDPRTHTLDPNKLEQMITPDTTGIIGVHLWGRVCDVDAIDAAAQRHNLAVLYDAAHALGCQRDGRVVGSFGRAEVLSFHATKYINCGEGGAVVTNDDQLAEKMRLMRNFGFVDFDKVMHVGTNGKMSEMAAAMGLTSLESREEFVSINRRNYLAYRSAFDAMQGLRVIQYESQDQPNYQYIVLEIDESVTQLSRDELVELCFSENVRARRYFWPGCHRMEPYRSYFPHAHLLLEQTEAVAGRVMLLPTGTAIGLEAIAAIGSIFRLAQQHGVEIRAALERRRGTVS